MDFSVAKPIWLPLLVGGACLVFASLTNPKGAEAQDVFEFLENEAWKRQRILESDSANVRNSHQPQSPLSGGEPLVSDKFWLLTLTPISNELGLSLKQTGRILELETEIDKTRFEHVERFKEINEMEPGAKYVKAKNELHAEVEALREKRVQGYQEILNKQQLVRLEQLFIQLNGHCQGHFSLLNDPDVRKLLEIDEKQQEQLTRRKDELEKEFREKYAQLVQTTREQLFAELTDEQRKKLESLTGEKLELSGFYKNDLDKK